MLLALALWVCWGVSASAMPEAEIPAEDLSRPAAGVIRLAGDETEIAGAAAYDDGVVIISSPGTYDVSGALTGRIDVEAEGPVELVLAGADITAPDGGSAITAGKDADLTVTLAAGTENRLSDGASAADDDAKAVLYAEGPLTVGGEGALTVTAGAKNGVQGKEGVTFAGGDIAVMAVNHTVKSRGPIAVTGGTLTLNAGNDGLAAEAGRLTAGDITVTGGTVTVVTGGGGGHAIDQAGESFGPGASQEVETESTVGAKGLKAEGDILISGGTLNVDSADDAIHAGGDVRITGGALTVRSSDDGVHADGGLTVDGGDIDITDCFEGLEAYTIDVNGGDIFIRAVNDGINANGPEMMFMASGEAAGTAETYFRQTGGTIDLAVTGNRNNLGDGVDSNGAVYIQGGSLLVSTFGGTMENGIDTGGTLRIDGGTVVAGGSSTMMEGVTAGETCCAAVVSTGSQAAGTEIVITDAAGNTLHSAVLVNNFDCLILTHPALAQGSVYTLTCGTDAFTLDFTGGNVVTVGAGGASGPMGGPRR